MKTVRLLASVLLSLVPSVLYSQVSYERIRAADSEPQHWLTYSGTYQSHRFSQLDQITPENVARLKSVWTYQVKNRGLIETTPLVVDGVMYLTEPPCTATALDLRTGKPLWSWQPALPRDLRTIGFPRVNRGIALLDDTVFHGTLDGHLVALDAKTGSLRWDVVVADNELGYSITAAPLAIDGKIIVGVAGGEAGIRGFLDAYDAKTGKLAWRFWTVPGPGDPGHDTWGGDSWKTGGGATWITGSYDPTLDLLYWGIGNPAPDWNGDSRPGDNLYTCSLVALEGATGKLRWHYQFTPHDTHDWDSNHVPVLVDGTFKGRPRKLVAVANRNAFYYLLDRETGEFLLGEPYAKQTWAKGIDEKGHPIVLPNTEPTFEGNLIYPSLYGATNWQSPSYNPETNLFYVSVRKLGAYYFKEEVEYKPGTYFCGGGERPLTEEGSGSILALEVETGAQKWEFPLDAPPWAGVLSTAGGLVFSGSNEGPFYALDAQTGKLLWQYDTGGMVRTNPISFSIDGKQHIAISARRQVFVFGLTIPRPRPGDSAGASNGIGLRAPALIKP
jgi:alcohol dehydrogenase (cytochrome c)